MSKDEAISTVLDSISEIRKFLETADDLENSLKKTTKKKHLLQNSKQFIDDLYTISNKIKTNFYAQYDKLEIEGENESETGEELEDKEVVDEGAGEIGNEDGEVVDEDGGDEVDESVQNIGNSSVENSNNVAEKDASKEAVNTINNLCQANCEATNEATNEVNNEATNEVINEVTNEVNNEVNNEVTNEATMEAAIDVTTEPKISDSEDLDIKPTFSKSIIRVVDLNKLIDPKQKKSVKFDSSVIILTSSDEEEAPIVPPKLKENGLKSSIEISSDTMSKQVDIFEPEVNIEEIKENSAPTNSRKSSRLKNVQVKKEVNRVELKKIFKRSSDKNFEIISKRPKRNNDNTKDSKQDKRETSSEEKNIMLDSSSGESDSERRSKSVSKGMNLTRKCKIKDPKFERKVYVPLPLIQCHKLKEVYNTDKDIFACSRSTRSSKRNRRTSDCESDNDSSKNKKTKTKEGKIVEDCKSDDESSDKDNLENLDEDMPNEKEINAEKHKKKENKKGSGPDAAQRKKDKSETKTGEEGDKDEKGDTTDEDEKTIKRNKEKTDGVSGTDEENSKEKVDTTNSRNKLKTGDNNDLLEEDEGKKIDEDQDSDKVDFAKKKRIKKNIMDEASVSTDDDETAKENNDANTNKTSEGRKRRNKTKSCDIIRESDEEISTKKTDSKKKKNKSKPGDQSSNSDEEVSEKKQKERKKRTRTKHSDKDRESDIDDDSTNKDVTKDGTETKTSEDESVDNDEISKKSNEEDEDVEESDKDQNTTKASKSDSEDEVKDKKIKKKTNELRKNETDESDGEQKEDDRKKGKNKVSSDSEDGNKKDDDNTEKQSVRKTKKHGHKLVVLSDSDDENEEKRESEDEKESDDSDKKKTKKKTKKKIKKAIVSDSDDDDNRKDKQSEDEKKSDSSSNSDDSEKKSDSDDEDAKKKTKRKSRIKKIKKSSSSDSEEEVSTRKHIRKVLDKDSLSETTKKAEEEEKERKARIAEKQKKYNRLFEEKKDATIESVVLDYHDKTKEPRISVHKKIVKNLKPHQVSGIQFMYDACFESVERTLKSSGSGCILAHCMGLGKTLQVVALTHTLLKHSDLTKVERVMVVCPINTVLNWKAEYQKWMPKKSEVEVYELATSKKNYERQYIVKQWYEDGGVLIIGYTMFRNLSNPANKRLTKKMRTDFHDGLVDPGPDMVICDEGHLLKNEKTHLSIAMNRIKTARRVVLTGTPLQNNLKEYWCMVQFIKPNLLGTYKEYMNRFVNPITNGQYTDSTQHDTVLMRKRSHVLHKLLDGVVQRRDYSVLEPYLPTKHEYVLFVKLSDTQIKLYKYYMEKLAKKNDGSNRTSFLFTDFQQLQRICTHPRVLADKTKEKKEKWDDEDEESEGSLKDFIDDGDDSSSKSSSSSASSNESNDSSASVKKKKKTRARVTRAVAAQRKENNEEDSDIEMISEVKKEWWQEYCDGDELDNIANSGKLSLFFEILKECEEIGDKILVFSQSLYTLNCIEYFLGKIDEATSNNDTEKLGGYKGTWELGLDYFRLDGSSSCDNRAYWCDSFNNPDNDRARLFLISTRAGGLGINLVAANRVIIFDVSWNPSHDLQSIYRVYRFGQTKPCYIYRFVTYGAMEMKIYERQVTKQAISKRVIDEQQIDRHYNQNDLQELYQCDLDPADRPIPLVPKDVLLGEMLQKYDKIIYKYHLHQSLLENKHEEGLNEEERKAAWDEFENEKVLRKTTLNAGSYLPNSANMSAQAINAALTNIVKRDNPNWSEAQIKGIIPALVRQLQIQIEENDMSMYQRVVQEIQIMNQAKLKESYYQQQMMKYYQQQMLVQKRQQALMGNLNINPVQIQHLFGANANYMNGAMAAPHFANGPSTSAQNRPPNDVIELND